MFTPNNDQALPHVDVVSCCEAVTAGLGDLQEPKVGADRFQPEAVKMFCTETGAEGEGLMV
jgi:hypothetical protein